MKNSNFAQTPCIPDKVYEDLPSTLKTLTKLFVDPRERDLILVSSLVVLSNAFSALRAKYDDRWIHPNLFCFIVAPPASNKGIMRFAKMLGDKINKDFLATHKELKRKYERDLRIWNKLSKKNPDIEEPAPEKPKLPLFYIPGNTSSTAIYNRLYDSNGTAVILETEADVLSGSISQEWGSFSHFLRGAYHHETASYARVSDDRIMIIENPRLSILLSGTPNQVPALISSGEDGLMSRFMFYCFESTPFWKDVRPKKGEVDKGEVFAEAGELISSIKELLEHFNLSFELTDEQHEWQIQHFTEKLNQVKENRDYISILNRLGLMTFKISMILTVLRNFHELHLKELLICSDEDFKTALQIVDTLKHHSFLMHSMLPHHQTEMNPRQIQFYELLPKNEEFTRNIANEVGKKIGISERSVGNYLGAYRCQGKLADPKYGSFLITEEAS